VRTSSSRVSSRHCSRTSACLQTRNSPIVNLDPIQVSAYEALRTRSEEPSLPLLGLHGKRRLQPPIAAFLSYGLHYTMMQWKRIELTVYGACGVLKIVGRADDRGSFLHIGRGCRRSERRHRRADHGFGGPRQAHSGFRGRILRGRGRADERTAVCLSAHTDCEIVGLADRDHQPDRCHGGNWPRPAVGACRWCCRRPGHWHSHCNAEKARSIGCRGREGALSWPDTEGWAPRQPSYAERLRRMVIKPRSTRFPTDTAAMPHAIK